MRDLDAIDEQLRDLGPDPRDRSGLLTRALGSDRSHDRLEELLADLADGAPAPKAGPVLMPAPFAAAATPAAVYDDNPDTDESEPPEAVQLAAAPLRDTLADRPSAAAAADESELSLSAEPSEPPPPAQDDSSRFAAMFDFTNPPPPRESMHGAPESPFDSPARARSTYPDPEPADEETTARRSVPPPPEPAVADDDADAEEADFELLVDDEDIIEIDDDEMIVDDE